MNFIRITSTNEENFAKAWELYEVSFPLYERRTLETHVQALNNNNFHCTYIEDNNIFIGILFYWELDSYIYLEHFAIVETLRGKGYGSKVLKKFSKSNKNIVLEIDPLVDDISIKRYHFYKNIGFKIYDFNHIQLPYRKGYEGYKLKILSLNADLNIDDYNEFYKLMFDNLSLYCEN